jgi:hypothetical protein
MGRSGMTGAAFLLMQKPGGPNAAEEMPKISARPKLLKFRMSGF